MASFPPDFKNGCHIGEAAGDRHDIDLAEGFGPVLGVDRLDQRVRWGGAELEVDPIEHTPYRLPPQLVNHVVGGGAVQSYEGVDRVVVIADAPTVHDPADA